jgi:4-amino-4-deoxy-L-arabinose transferase-like glycosyltransferase
VALLLVAVAAGYGTCLVDVPLMRAEALYALIPLEMLCSGDWLTPTLFGVPYLDKPPLFYWLQGLALWAWGAGETTARLVNLGLALGEVWLTYRLGGLLLEPRAAWLGACALAASLGFFVFHLELLADHLITCWLLASICLWLKWLTRPGLALELGFFACLAGGFLSKGGIGLVFPLAIAGLGTLAARRPAGLALLGSLRGWALLGLILLPWLVVMELEHPGFFHHQVINEQLRRFLGQRHPPDIHPFSLGAFWLLFALWLLPWTPLLPGALARFAREEAARASAEPWRRVLLVWPAVVLGFFSLSASRVEYYSLPALPPLALVAGWRLERGLTTPNDGALAWSLLTLAAAAALPLVFLPNLEGLLAANRREFLGLSEALAPLVPLALAVLAGWGLAGGIAGLTCPRLAVVCYFGLALSLLTFSHQAILVLSPRLSDRLPGEWLRHHLQPEDVVVMETVEELEYAASLAFYAGRRAHIVVRGGLPQFPRAVTPEQSYLITPERLAELWRGSNRVYLLVDESAEPAEPWRQALPVWATAGKYLLTNRPWVSPAPAPSGAAPP